MICGIGVDTVEIQRVSLSMARRGWLERIFSQEECRALAAKGCSAETVAGRFAAKEAVGKALGRTMSLRDFRRIGILADETGRPRVNISPSLIQEIGWTEEKNLLHVSISHDKGRAVAFALWEHL